MTKPERMKKQISFSEPERDIFEYLKKQKNASALIKRLVYNHMLMEQGMIQPPKMVVSTSTPSVTNEVTQGTPNIQAQTATQQTIAPKQEKPEEPQEPQEKELTEEELENLRYAQELDI